MTTSGPRSIASFRRRVLAAADELDRGLDWLSNREPWSIFVREVMLQQTSLARVEPVWREFLVRFESPSACAKASLADVLRSWGALGFPRRAQNLHRSAQLIVAKFDGCVPSDLRDLLELPGIGPYSARAIASFAFDVPVGVVDTNVGRVLARCVVNGSLRTSEAQSLVDEITHEGNSATLNQALINLGSRFCQSQPQCVHCPLQTFCRWQRDGGDDPARKSAGVSQPQKPFAGSDRQARGQLLARLRDAPSSKKQALNVLDESNLARSQRLLAGLHDEGLVTVTSRTVRLGRD